MASKNKYYAVIRGYQPGIYTAWYGSGGAEEQVRGYAGALYKGFVTAKEARHWIENPAEAKAARFVAHKEIPTAIPSESHQQKPPAMPGQIIIYTDGGCVGNPGPGGYGAVIIEGNSRKELAQGFRRTTNNRMELMGCIAALGTIEAGADIILHSDSRYVVNGISKGWARKWRSNGWMRTDSDKAENVDLWAKLLDLCERHRIRFVWVHGHTGNLENERCDLLATDAAKGRELAEDHAYVRGRTKIPEDDPQATQLL